MNAGAALWRTPALIVLIGIAAGANNAQRGWVETIGGGGPVGDGGAALAARLSLPGGVLVAPGGDLIVVDFGNHRVRRVARGTGVIATVAGTGEPGFAGDGGPATAARLARPENAAFAPDGALFIVDSHNHRVRRVDAATGIITTVVGSGEPGFSGDGGPALAAQLNQPEGIAFDRNGNFYIGDTLNGRVRRVASNTGIISTVAGSGEIGASPDGTPALEAKFMRVARLAVDAGGDVYIADSPTRRIHRISHQSGRLSTVAGTGAEGFSGDGGQARDARLSYPEGVIVVPDGSVLFADLGNHRVRRVDGRSGVITTLAGDGGKGFSGDGGPAVQARLWSPGRLAMDANGDVFIADIINARIRRIDARSGAIATVAGSGDLGDGRSARTAMLTIPGDLALWAQWLFVADYGNRRVRRIDLETGTIDTVAGGGTRTGDAGEARTWELRLPEAIGVSRRGEVYVADSLAHRVWRVDPVGDRITVFAGTGSPGDSGDGGAATAASLNIPGAIAVGPDGTVYVGDFGNSRLRAIAPDGRIHAVDAVGELRGFVRQPIVSLTSTTSALFWVVSGDSHVYRLDYASRRLTRLLVRLGYRSEQPGTFQFADLAVDGSRLILADTLAHRVVAIDLESGVADVLAGNGTAAYSGDGPALNVALFRPGAVAVSGRGDIFIADTFSHRVRRLSTWKDVP